MLELDIARPTTAPRRPAPAPIPFPAAHLDQQQADLQRAERLALNRYDEAMLCELCEEHAKGYAEGVEDGERAGQSAGMTLGLGIGFLLGGLATGALVHFGLVASGA